MSERATINAWPLLPLREAKLADVLSAAGKFTLCANDPPWARLAATLPAPTRLVLAGNMALPHLESLLADEPDSDVVIGLGGGSAIDTAKFIAWKCAKPLVQIPSITSVDAAFTDAVGVRVDGRVRYIGPVLPREVVLDVELVQSAPAHMNRGGIGDVLSCHTGLWDWAFAVRAGKGVAWHDEAAALGRLLLAELDEMADEIRVLSGDAVRWLAGAYRRVGAACAALRHSRFEEGSEHFLAYAYEHIAGAHVLHGELIALCVAAMSEVQGNDAAGVRRILERTGVRAHPADLGIEANNFVDALLSLRDYAVRESLDWSIAHAAPIDAARAQAIWQSLQTLPRV